MTNEERTLALDYLEKMQKTYVDGEGYEAHPLPEWYALEVAIKALDAQPSEDTEVIKVSKGAVKSRQGRFVIYDVDWLKKNFYSTEEKIYGQPKQPCEDCISREAVLDVINFEDKWLFDAKSHNADTKIAFSGLESRVKALPPVTPKYTDEEIDKAQAVEQAYVDKMVELAVEELRREWLNSFDTSSATKCFEAVNLLKQRLEGEE